MIKIKYISILFLYLPCFLFSQVNTKKKETYRWLAPCFEFSLNNKFVYGISWKMNKTIGISLITIIEKQSRYERIIKDRDYEGNPEPEKIGYHFFKSGNQYYSLSIDYNYNGDNDNIHSFEMGYKEIRDHITFHKNYYSGGTLYTVKYNSDNQIFYLNYKYNRVLDPSILLIGRIGLLANSYRFDYPPSYQKPYSKVIVKPHFDIGIVFRPKLLNY